MSAHRRAFWLVLALPILCRPAFGQTAAEQRAALEVSAGRCEAVLASEHPDDQYYLVVGSLARSGTHRVTVQTAATTEPERLPLEQPISDDGWKQTVQDRAERQERARRSSLPPEPIAPS